jgi:hypothetical protein
MNMVVGNSKICTDDLISEKGRNNLLDDVLRNWNVLAVVVKLGIRGICSSDRMRQSGGCGRLVGRDQR